MDQKHLSSLQELEYANLSKEENDKLKEFEDQFNSTYNKDVFFMVMKK